MLDLLVCLGQLPGGAGGIYETPHRDWDARRQPFFVAIFSHAPGAGGCHCRRPQPGVPVLGFVLPARMLVAFACHQAIPRRARGLPHYLPLYQLHAIGLQSAGLGPVLLTSGHVTLRLSASCTGLCLPTSKFPVITWLWALKPAVPGDCSAPAAYLQQQHKAGPCNQPGKGQHNFSVLTAIRSQNRKVYIAYLRKPLKHLVLVTEGKVLLDSTAHFLVKSASSRWRHSIFWRTQT